MPGDWIKLYRKMLKSAVFTSRDPALFKVWIAILLEANWERRQLDNGQVLEPGQLVIAQRRFANEFKFSRQKFRTCLEKLGKCGNLTHKATQHGTLITICNWGTYQQADESAQPTQQPKSNPRATQEQPKSNPRSTLEEEVKKGRSKEGKKRLEEASASSSSPDGDEKARLTLAKLISLWNEIPGAEHCRYATKKRKAAFRARAGSPQWLSQVPEGLERITRSKFCQGGGGRNWRASLDWFLRPDSLAHVLEGRYDAREAAKAPWDIRELDLGDDDD